MAQTMPPEQSKRWASRNLSVESGKTQPRRVAGVRVAGQAAGRPSHFPLRLSIQFSAMLNLRR
jgi:hypothetical protein